MILLSSVIRVASTGSGSRFVCSDPSLLAEH
jgi:hypothetical protein